MKIKTFKIKSNKNISMNLSGTLDEITRALPQGLYTTLTTSAGGERALGLRDHLNRLYMPANEMKIKPAVSEEILRERMILLAKENFPHESKMRLILIKDSGDMYILVQVFEPLPESVYRSGVHVITTNMARHDATIKDTGFIAESAAQRKLLNKDVFEILLAKNGRVLEGMTSNFYVVRHEGLDTAAAGMEQKQNLRSAAYSTRGYKLITARRGILPGVTRRSILKIAREQGMGIEYRAPRLDETFEEAFLTSSSRGVVPIVSIDDKLVGQGSVGKWAQVLARAYKEYVKRKSDLII